ncbi:hypothetical protein RB199_37750 [Streptomyces libani]|uniref:Uncharacterized protein n=1 Tax=Streptomyces nigrescens TaxID=1920 RepID=A0A640TWM6_STRNI|nr:hypothetical protein [Streptomyces libani]WAT94453.1 hypothetical protein STRLI_000059 [Streptomyces libani subsp. libani]GFE27594.1 hypothetical protein Sliba_80470 [Streptomyces libani subsp. libani]GGW08656.1 hypothetical protein GCM10010500_79890 [Streptomyces libani subsp. libani]
MRNTLIRAGVVSGAALSALIIGGAADAAPAAPQAPATASRVTAVQQHPKGIECHWKTIRVYDKIIYKTPDGKYAYRLIVTFKKVPDCKVTLPKEPPPLQHGRKVCHWEKTPNGQNVKFCTLGG